MCTSKRSCFGFKKWSFGFYSAESLLSATVNSKWRLDSSILLMLDMKRGCPILTKPSCFLLFYVWALPVLQLGTQSDTFISLPLCESVQAIIPNRCVIVGWLSKKRQKVHLNIDTTINGQLYSSVSIKDNDFHNGRYHPTQKSIWKCPFNRLI